MAGQDRRPSSSLKLELLKEGHAFSFFQVLRLLPFFTPPGKEGEVKGEDDGHIRMRPELSLAFPPSDVAGIEELEDQDEEITRFLVTVRHLGLYGPSSPLPTFYTEDLISEASEDESVTRDFIDIINHRLFFLLFRCWSKYRQCIQVVEKNNTKHIQRLFSLFGLGEKTLRLGMPEAYSLIRYLGLLTQYPRSAAGLQALLRDALGKVPVEVISCIKRTAVIPEDQRLRLGRSGHVLGQNSYLGEQIDDRMGKFRLRIGPLNGKKFQAMLPGRGECEKVAFLTKFYMIDPLAYEVELVLAEKEAGCVCLGAPEWSKLGLDTWTFSGPHIGEVSAGFAPDMNQQNQ